MSDLSVEVGHPNGAYYKVRDRSVENKDFFINYFFFFFQIKAIVLDVDSTGIDIKYDQE